MAEYDVQSAMERIEGKLDTVIKDHEHRISTAEALITNVKDDLHDEKVISWIKLGGVYVGGILSHLGLTKAGWKI